MNAIRLSLPSLAILAAAPHALADEVLHALAGGTGEVPRTVLLSVPRFEPTLGRLDEVRFQLHLVAQGGIGIENLSPSVVSPTATLTWRGSLAAGPGSDYVVAEASASGFAMLGMADGVVDYDGSSGETILFDPMAVFGSAVHAADAAVRDQFVHAAGGDPLTSLELRLEEIPTVEGLPTGLSISHSEASYLLEVVYVYTVRITPTCFGDGTGTGCPCDNAGWLGHGCANSAHASGALLAGEGLPSVTADSLVLRGSRMPNTTCLLLQGTSVAGGGAGTAFGDGLRCAGGSVVRVGNQPIVSGSAEFPAPGKPAISFAGSVPAVGGERIYQAWYRNSADYCTSATFNFTNAVRVLWMP